MRKQTTFVMNGKKRVTLHANSVDLDQTAL